MSNRARLIHNPIDAVKLHGGRVGYIFLNGLKSVTDSYIGGLSP